MMQFRLLRADEIDCRISTVSEKGLSLLLYKDARCDMNILDETVGSENWQRSHELINGNLFCNVGIKCGSEWVWKQDVGTESYTEKEKGQASDSFKRACFNWGIGRELYTAPFMWVPAACCNIFGEKPKMKCFDTFTVTALEYDGRKISFVEVVNNKTRKTMQYGSGAKPIEQPAEKPSLRPATMAQKRTVQMLCEKYNIDLDKWLSSNNTNIELLTDGEAGQILQTIRKKYGDE